MLNSALGEQQLTDYLAAKVVFTCTNLSQTRVMMGILFHILRKLY